MYTGWIHIIDLLGLRDFVSRSHEILLRLYTVQARNEYTNASFKSIESKLSYILYVLSIMPRRRSKMTID